MIRPLGLLLFTSVALWTLLAGPAWLQGGAAGLLLTAAALALCLVPMTATFLWSHWALRNAPEQQLLAVLGGTSVRLFVVALGAVALFRSVEALHRPAFLIWVIVFYLATLTLEVVVVVRGQPPANRPQQPPC